MDRQLEQLVRGDLSTRIELLKQAEDPLLAEIICKINSLTEDMHTVEERYELNALNHTCKNAIGKLINSKTPFAVKAKILKSRYAPMFIHKLIKLKKVQKRKRRHCPYPGCYKFGILQLHNHLRQVHKLEDKKERQHWLDVARCGYKEQESIDAGHLDAKQQAANTDGEEAVKTENNEHGV